MLITVSIYKMNPNYWHQLWKNKKVKYIREIHSKNTPKIQTSTFFRYHLLCFSKENSPIHFLASRSKKSRILDSSRKKKLKMSCLSKYRMTWVSTTLAYLHVVLAPWSFRIIWRKLRFYYRVVVDRLNGEAFFSIRLFWVARPKSLTRSLHFLCSFSLSFQGTLPFDCVFVSIKS